MLLRKQKNDVSQIAKHHTSKTLPSSAKKLSTNVTVLQVFPADPTVFPFRKKNYFGGIPFLSRWHPAANTVHTLVIRASISQSYLIILLIIVRHPSNVNAKFLFITALKYKSTGAEEFSSVPVLIFPVSCIQFSPQKQRSLFYSSAFLTFA